MDFWKDKSILLTGGAGFLGSHIVENLVGKRGVSKTQITIPRSSESDLRIYRNCKKAVEGADVVVHLAAKVGGIGFNQKYPGTLFYDNIIMVHNSWRQLDWQRLRSSFKSVQFALTQSLHLHPSGKKTYGTGILRKQTLPTALLRKPSW